MVTFDLTNLNSNIPYMNRKTGHFILDRKLPRNITLIIESRELKLNDNCFQFDNIKYIQTLGTAIGTKMVLTCTLPQWDEAVEYTNCLSAEG